MNVPLFNREGNILKWAHKSLQDFFAASFISLSARKEQIVNLIYSSQKSNYLNIIDFLYDMEYEITRNVIEYEIAKAFIEFCNSSYLNFPQISDLDIIRRQEIAFDISSAFMYVEGEPFNERNRSLLSKHMSISRNMIEFAWGFDETYPLDMYHHSSSSFRYEIISILSKKSNSITKEYKSKLSSMRKLVDVFTDKLNPRVDVVYQLDDKNNNPLNSVELFALSTELFNSAKHTVAGTSILDYRKCKRLIESVEKSMKMNKEAHELDGI